MIFLLIFLSFPTFSLALESIEDSEQVYEFLEGAWVAPQSGELDMFFYFQKEGYFTITMKPVFEYSNLSIMEQSLALATMQTEEENSISVFRFLEDISEQEGLVIEAEILLNEEYSTNILDITKDKIYIYDAQTNKKTIFIQRPELSSE
jgi:hypothetical protein